MSRIRKFRVTIQKPHYHQQPIQNHKSQQNRCWQLMGAESFTQEFRHNNRLSCPFLGQNPALGDYNFSFLLEADAVAATISADQD
jgi:hypothetical protein